MLTAELGLEVRRKLGAGRLDDIGDLDGLEEWTAQVAWWPANTLRAFREKPLDCERQQLNGRSTFGVSFVRMNGGVWRAVQTIPQWIQVFRETSW